MSATRIGLRGFGRLGRQIFRLALDDPRLEVVAIADSGQPEILHRLLCRSMPGENQVKLNGTDLVSRRFGTDVRTRILPAGMPGQNPWWDVFGAELIIETAGDIRSSRDLLPHLANGAQRVILATPPADTVDRLVIYGINQHTIDRRDRIVSAGSASITAMALALQVVARGGSIRHATMTSVHAYSADQGLHDHAGPDYRLSRSGARNIIPTSTGAARAVGEVLPELNGRLDGIASRVPVPDGSVVDLFVELEHETTVEQVHEALQSAAASPRLRNVLQFIREPVVSSDIIGNPHSTIFDASFTQLVDGRFLKSLSWYDNEWGYSNRVCDLLGIMSTYE